MNQKKIEDINHNINVDTILKCLWAIRDKDQFYFIAYGKEMIEKYITQTTNQMKKTAEDFLMKYGIPSDTTIGIEGDHKLTDLLEEYRSQSELPSEDVKRIANNFFQWTENLNKGDSMYSELLRCNEYNLRLQDQINSLLASHVARIKEMEERPTISSNDIMIELFAMAGMKNEDGMKVIEYLDKENGGSIAYLRHDAVVKTINKLTPPKP